MDHASNTMNLSASLLETVNTASPENITSPAAADPGHPEAYLYDIANDLFMYMDPVIVLVGLIGNGLSFAVMRVSCVFVKYA